jgi:hypothetical protein
MRTGEVGKGRKGREKWGREERDGRRGEGKCTWSSEEEAKCFSSRLYILPIGSASDLLSSSFTTLNTSFLLTERSVYHKV